MGGVRIPWMVTGRTVVILVGLGVVCLALGVVRLCVGATGFGIPDSDAILALRVDRVWSAVLVGGSLGVAGVLLQSLLRNPLAAPDLMGLSAGAGFAITVAGMVAGGALGIGASAGPALVGAVGVLLLVWGLSSRRGVIDPVTMILIGVIVSVILGSATLLVASQMSDRGFSTARWMMGSLRDDLDRGDLVVGSVIALVVVGWSVVSAGAYDASALGDDEARSVGVRLGRVRVGQLVGAGVLTTVSIVLAGPIGFVGLVSPHLVRLVLGARHSGLIVGSALVGASLVLGADVAARFVRTDAGLIPVGVLTSLVGGPIFLVLLLKERRTGAGN